MLRLRGPCTLRLRSPRGVPPGSSVTCKAEPSCHFVVRVEFQPGELNCRKHGEGCQGGWNPEGRVMGAGMKNSGLIHELGFCLGFHFQRSLFQAMYFGLGKTQTLEITFKGLGGIRSEKETKATASARDPDNGEGEGGEGAPGSVLVLAAPISGFYIWEAYLRSPVPFLTLRTKRLARMGG